MTVRVLTLAWGWGELRKTGIFFPIFAAGVLIVVLGNVRDVTVFYVSVVLGRKVNDTDYFSIMTNA